MNFLVVEREMAYARANMTTEQKLILNKFFTDNNRKVLLAGLVLGFTLSLIGFFVSVFFQVI